MRSSDGFQSWTVAEGEPGALVHALYARDASGLDVGTDPPIPALDPAVEIEARFAVHATPRAAAEWPACGEAGLAPPMSKPGSPRPCRSRARPAHVLVSRELHGDQAALRSFLAPVIQTFA